MKICFLMPTHWSAGLGGAEVQVKNIMAYLRRHTTHELSMICRRSELGVEDGTPIYVSARAHRNSRRYYVGTDFLKVYRLLEHISPDVVYCRRGTPLVGIAALYCRKHKKRLVFHVAHAQDVTASGSVCRQVLTGNIGRAVFEYGLHHADAILCQAKYQSALLRSSYGLESTAIAPNVHPVPPEQEKTDYPIKVVWMANLKPSKRPELFVDLARKFETDSKYQFIMIGGVQDPQYAGLLEDASSIKNFLYVGPQPLERANKHLDDAHVFINTSKANQEGFPNTFIQAWLRQVPVVTLDVDPDNLIEVHGLGVSCHGSFQRMVEALRTAAIEREELRLRGLRARQFAAQTYGDENCARIVAVIEGGRQLAQPKTSCEAGSKDRRR